MNDKILFKLKKNENLHIFWQPLAAILDLYLSKQFPGNAREFFCLLFRHKMLKSKDLRF